MSKLTAALAAATCLAANYHVLTPLCTVPAPENRDDALTLARAIAKAKVSGVPLILRKDALHWRDPAVWKPLFEMCPTRHHASERSMFDFVDCRKIV